MKTRMGSKVASIVSHNRLWVMLRLVGDDESSPLREIHVADLRWETDEDRELLDEIAAEYEEDME